MDEKELATLQHLIDEWLHYEMQGWVVMAQTCYIAAHNYYVYTVVRKRSL